MSVVGDSKARHFHQHVRKGAVPLGQHSHHPDAVWPLPPPEPGEPATVPTGVYAGLATPAWPGQPCVACGGPAILRPPGPRRAGDAYCAEHWISGVVQRA